MTHTFNVLKPAAIFMLCFAVSTVCAQPVNPTPMEPKAETKFPEASAFAKSTISYKIISAANNTFGYDILADGRMLIHQPSVPGLPGNKGFKTKQGAQSVAQLVITKIKKGEMPPTISEDEMKKLKAI